MSNTVESLAFVVPVRDFAKGLPRFLAAWREQCRKHNIATRFAIIDDGSADPLVATETDALLVRNDVPTGLGSCIRQGDSALGGDEPLLILVPDYGYRPTDLGDFISAFKDVDMVLGVRPGQMPPNWLRPWQRLGGWLRRWLFGIPQLNSMPWNGWAALRRRWSYRFNYGPKLQDPGVGIVLVRRSILDRCPIQSTGGFAILEMIAKANFLGALIAEVAIGKPDDMPVMKGRFEFHPSDERRVFRQPTFGKSVEQPIAVDSAQEKTPGLPPGVS